MEKIISKAYLNEEFGSNKVSDSIINEAKSIKLRDSRYDEVTVFLSHKHEEIKELGQVIKLLKTLGVNVYVDWVSDRDALKRELTNVNTANTIIERLKTSKALLYIHTEASQSSKWAPWELGFFHALKDKICIYNPNNIEKAPYLEIYPTVILENQELLVETVDGRISIKKWIEQ